MEETFSNIIRQKYEELIRLISLIGDEVRIEDKWSRFSLSIDVYKNKRNLLSFKLYKSTESSSFIDIAWGILGYDIGHWCFPEYFDQKYMFNKLIFVIINWYNNITSSDIDKVLDQSLAKSNSKDNILASK